MEQKSKSEAVSHWLTAILLAGLLIRLVWGLSRPVDQAAIDLLPDQRGYLELARNLLHGQGLHYTDERFAGPLYAARTPGYPVLIAMCGGSVRVVRVVQALLDTSTVLAVYLLARRFTQSRPVPLIAATLVAFNPFLVYFSALLLTETLYTAMLAWGMVLLWRQRAWVWGILLLVLAIQVRPSGIFLPVILAALSSRHTPSPQPSPGGRGSVRTLVAGTLTVVVMLPWAWRNHLVLDRWLWTTSNDGITAYDGLHAGATGQTDQSFVSQMPQVKTMSELQRSDFFAAEAKRFARENPGEVFRLTLIKIGRTWTPVPLSQEFGRPLYRAVAITYALPLDILIVVGIVAGGLPRSAKVYLLVPALYFTAVHAMSVGSLRYRMPVEPLMAVLAAFGAVRVIKKDRG